ncbi:MAG: DUF3575 domain-containing protein [Cyclobacteriaceae bacterium]|nr:DUF3575 domain-containing protein [Cyclobacteriaceae bacterium]
MKKNLLVVLVVLMGGAFTSANAQENVIKINIFSPIVKTFNASFERKVSATNSFQIGAFFTSYNPESTKFSGFGLTPEYRFYLSESEAPAGVYVAPFVRYQNFKLTEESSSSKGTFSSFGGGLVIGKQWIFKEKISLDIFIGPQYSSGNVKVTSGSDTFDTNVFDGFGIRTGLTLGFAF